jgi:hypothetical protein
MKLLAAFFLGWEDRIEMGDEHDRLGVPRSGAGPATEKEVMTMIWVARGNEIGFETEGGKALGGQATQSIHSGGVGGEAVAFNHAAQPIEGGRQVAGGGGLELLKKERG